MVTLNYFDQRIIRRSLLTHYFYQQKWSKGELTLEDLRTYAKEYFHFVKCIPGIVACVRKGARKKHANLLARIEENLSEEIEHVELWKRFSQSLGIPEVELIHHCASPKTKEAVRKLEECAKNSFEEGTATIYALELDLPRIAKSKKDGLCSFYGLTGEDAHCYFDEHLDEEKHFSLWQTIEVDVERAERAIQTSLDAQHQLLDAICDLCGISCSECCSEIARSDTHSSQLS